MSDNNFDADNDFDNGIEDQNQDGSGVDKALFDELNGRVSKLEERAAQMGFTSVEQYQEWLEQEAYKNIENSNRGSDNEPKKTVPQQQQNSNVSKPDLSIFDERFDTIGKGVSHAVLEAQYSTYTINQLTTEEEKRSPNTKDDMAKLIHGPKGVLVQSLAQDFNGNLWEAANYLLTVEGGTAKAHKRGMQTQAALNQAKNSNLQSGAGFQSQQQQKKEIDPSQALADAIAPKQGGYTEPA